jgi:hypothetical protein
VAVAYTFQTAPRHSCAIDGQQDREDRGEEACSFHGVFTFERRSGIEPMNNANFCCELMHYPRKYRP